MILKVCIQRGKLRENFVSSFPRPKTANAFLKKVCKKHDFEGAYIEGGNLQKIFFFVSATKILQTFLRKGLVVFDLETQEKMQVSPSVYAPSKPWFLHTFCRKGLQ